MQIIRPIEPNDFVALKQIAVDSGHGFTSLPVNDEVLANKIKLADASFQKQVTQADHENYLFVLEDTKTGKVIGTTGINASIGLKTPIYHYRQVKSEIRSAKLNLVNTVNTLSMCNDYIGSSEICTLFLSPDHRKGYSGRLLSRVRFLFMAEHPHRFADTIIAEMRGVSDEHGKSPFWHWLQTHFVDLDFPTVDYLMGIGDTDFIAQLMPKYPIYTNLLTPNARAAIGQVHDNTKPALRLLEKEGFKFRGYVDLFDAGPTVESKLTEIETVKHSQNGAVHISAATPPAQKHEGKEPMYAICNQKVTDFRATYSTAISHDPEHNTVTLSPEVASALKVTSGEAVRFIRL